MYMYSVYNSYILSIYHMKCSYNTYHIYYICCAETVSFIRYRVIYYVIGPQSCSIPLTGHKNSANHVKNSFPKIFFKKNSLLSSVHCLFASFFFLFSSSFKVFGFLPLFFFVQSESHRPYLVGPTVFLK